MSLLVNNYRYVDDGSTEIFDAPDSSEELAGGERCRTDLFGSGCAKNLGLNLLPTLANGDLYAENEALDILALEAKTLYDQSDAVFQGTGYQPDYVRRIAQNILLAVHRAQASGGGVVIW